MELEELNPSALIGPQQDVESIERWAERNGISYGTVRAWVYRGVLPSVKLGKLRMVNSALLRNWLLEQEWTA
ncbi:TPA: helix-turn-helix domain-containing protein [Pseudomonas aeruginosa]|uniref:DNA-binding protein n=1 Tax=Pseudomonas aeruginosa TaxID=287 RepID=UPI0037077B16